MFKPQPFVAQLRMKSGPTPGKIYALQGDQFTAGRDANNAVPINDAELSRKHARFTLQGGKYVLEDLGSTNGTFVNRKRLAGPCVLKTGDIVSFGGQIVLVYEGPTLESDRKISEKPLVAERLANSLMFGDDNTSYLSDEENTISKLSVFLCHASNDKPIVRELYNKLISEDWIDPWIDEEDLLPGQDWDIAIEKAVESSHAVIVLLSTRSVTKEGYIQRELRFALEIALEKPEETIFIIPVRLDDCPVPRRLRTWQYIDFFPTDRKKWAYERILKSLKIRFEELSNNNFSDSMFSP
jgi:pSer/pThr/pTyr-binding forkhead associated (FHA) protein